MRAAAPDGHGGRRPRGQDLVAQGRHVAHKLTHARSESDLSSQSCPQTQVNGECWGECTRLGWGESIFDSKALRESDVLRIEIDIYRCPVY